MERKGWTEDELSIMRKYYPIEGIGVKTRLPGRTENQIYGVAWHYGIKNNSRKNREQNVYPMKKYTPKEIEYIKKHFDTDGAEAVGAALNRTPNAIRSIVCKLNLSETRPPVGQSAWTLKEIEIVKEYFPKEGVVGVEKRLPNRTRAAIYSEASHLGVSHNKRTKQSSNSAWSEEEDNIIKEHYCQDGLNICCELLPGRSKQAIIVRANRHLGIRKREKKNME